MRKYDWNTLDLQYLTFCETDLSEALTIEEFYMHRIRYVLEKCTRNRAHPKIHFLDLKTLFGIEF